MYDGTFFATNQDIIIVTFGFRGNGEFFILYLFHAASLPYE